MGEISRLAPGAGTGSRFPLAEAWEAVHQLLSARAFQNALQASEHRQAIQELMQLACGGTPI